MARPVSIAIKRSAYIWCLQIQDSLMAFANSSVHPTKVVITLPREVHYAINSNHEFLVKSFPFLGDVRISIRQSSQPMSVFPIKVETETPAVKTDDPEMQKMFYDQDLPDEVRYKYDVPDWFYKAEEGRVYVAKGEADEYLKIVDQRYLDWCKQQGKEPEYK